MAAQHLPRDLVRPNSGLKTHSKDEDEAGNFTKNKLLTCQLNENRLDLPA